MKKPKRVHVSMEECRRSVTIDFEREMGIYDALKNNPDAEMLQLVADARKALEPTIDFCTEHLYKWYAM